MGKYAKQLFLVIISISLHEDGLSSTVDSRAGIGFVHCVSLVLGVSSFLLIMTVYHGGGGGRLGKVSCI